MDQMRSNFISPRYRISVKLCLVFSFLIFFIVPSIPVLAEEAVAVGYGGIYTSGNENNFHFFKANKVQLNKTINSALELLVADKKLPFDLLLETDIESRKTDIDHPYSMAIILTRDDVANEHFSTSVAQIQKTIVNVGMVLIIYQTVQGNFGKRNSIVFSIPLVGYSVNLEGKEPITEKALNDLFIKTARTTVQDHIANRMRGISLAKVEGLITDVKDGKVTINAGAAHGLTEGQNVNIVIGGNKKISARVVSLRQKDAVIKPSLADFKPEKNMKVYGYNMKGLSDETYQVVSFTISSKKAAKTFDDNILGPQVSQWISDFISERTGKVVLPSKVGGSG